jgi:hypothetical protein
VFVYSYIASEKGSLVEYNDDLAVKNLKSFCQEHLPRFSKRVHLNHFEFASSTTVKLPRVMLLSTKKDTPVIWRVLSGLYRKRFIFYDAEVCYDCLLAYLFFFCMDLYWSKPVLINEFDRRVQSQNLLERMRLYA